MSVRWCPQGKAVQGFPELPLLVPGFPPPCSAVLSTTELMGLDMWWWWWGLASAWTRKRNKWLICQEYVMYIKKEKVKFS